MKHLVIILTFLGLLSLKTRANMDCIYMSSKKGITIKCTSPCFNQKYQTFIDSFLNKLLITLNRTDSSKEILVLVNYEQLYFDDSKVANFISVGFDSLKEMNQDYILRYFYDHFNSSAENRLKPIDVNFTDKKEASKKGIKIIYNYDYQLGPPIWSDIEKLIIYSDLNFTTIEGIQKTDTVRHYSSYVKLSTLDSFYINRILGKTAPAIEEKFEPVRSISNVWLLSLVSIAFALTTVRLIKKHSS